MPPVEQAAVEEWICSCCGYVYEAAEGDPEHGIPPGTPFASLPECWKCPWCCVLKSAFNKF